MRPLRVYLDSSDFSTLSGANRSKSHEAILEQLCELADGGRVSFVFSACHLMEIAPLSPLYASASNARAETLVRLCRRNCLLSFDRLLRSEAESLAKLSPVRFDAVSPSGEWYPDWGDLVSPVQQIDTFKEELQKAGTSHGLNRKQRRALQSQLVGAGRLKPLAKKLLASGPSEDSVAELLRHYPMRSQDMQILWRYFIGQATADEANSAFLESLRDPRWMIQWFAEHHGQLSPFIEWLRGPSTALADTCRQLADRARRFRMLRAAVGLASEPTLSVARWNELRNESLVSTASKVFSSTSAAVPASTRGEDVVRHCPGLGVAITTLHWVLWDVTITQPRTPKNSDFADAIHSMYAPYVDVFRADAYMAPRVSKAVEPYGTSVVSRLESLVQEIQRRLQG